MNNELVTVSHCLFKKHIEWINEKAAEDERSNSYILRKLIDKAMQQESEQTQRSKQLSPE